MYTMEYYSAVKRNEVFILAAKGINLKNTMLSKISQANKDK